MKYFSTFSGVEGMNRKIAGGEPVGFSEVNKQAASVLRYLYPKTKNYGDIKQINWSEVPDFDLLTGGSPCQDFSVAGKREGLAGARSSLAWEYIRCLREKQPAYFIWENVKGVMSSRRGWDFANLLCAFSESGYSLWWQVLNAKHFGAPQNRERVFVVGSRDGSLPEVFFIQESNRGDSAEAEDKGEVSKSLTTNSNRQDPTAQSYSAHSLTTRQSPPSGTQRREHENYIAYTFKAREDSSPDDKHPRTLIATTLNTRGGTRGGSTTPTSLIIRRLTPLESERCMSWPDDWTKKGINEKGGEFEVSDAQRYKMIGNGVVSNVVEDVAFFLLPSKQSKQ